MANASRNDHKDYNQKNPAISLNSRPEEVSNSLDTAAEALAKVVNDPALARSISRKSAGVPVMLDRLMKARRGRSEFFPTELFSDPAWEILLDLFAAEYAQRRISVTSLGLAADVPSTTAQRWISTLAEMGMVRRRQDPLDARRIYVELHPDTSLALKKYFAFVEDLPVN